MVATSMQNAAFALSERLRLGDYSGFGSEAAAQEALAKAVNAAALAVANARGNAANAARALRGMRGEFQVAARFVDLAKLAGSPQELSDLLHDTGGDPRQMARLLNPGIWEQPGYSVQKLGAFWQYMMINGLISSPYTHSVILLNNVWQLGARPFERMLGSSMKYALGQASSADSLIIRQNMRQYRYMVSATMDSWQAARQAFKAADSLLAPHTQETTAQPMSTAQYIAQLKLKPWNSPTNILHNTLSIAAKGVGLPSRMVTMQDEFVRQVAYRSLVAAEAEQAGLRLGLRGDALRQHVQDEIAGSFDVWGHATNDKLLNEANVVTAQQDINLPADQLSFGRQSFGHALSNFRTQLGAPGAAVVPFVKTPVNLFREGINLTPGFNFARKQFRLAFTGQSGPEAQAQAIGQMGVGLLTFGAMAAMAHAGYVTGAGPSDAKTRSDLMKTGWRPYSFVVQQGGKRVFIPFSRMDPIAYPMGLIADLMSLEHINDPAQEDKRESLAMTIGTALIHEVTDKMYLDNVNRMIEALTEPDKDLNQGVSGLARNYLVPYSALLRTPLNGDPYMRDAQTVWDNVMANVPGLSENLPPKRDTWGDPIVHAAPTWSAMSPSIADQELERFAMQQHVDFGPPEARVEGIDLRDITLADGRNAYDAYVDYYGHPVGAPPLKAEAEQLIDDDGYQQAPDYARTTRGTKENMLSRLLAEYQMTAEEWIKSQPEVAQQIYQKQQKMYDALSAKTPNPTRANKTSAALSNLGKLTGVDLHSVSGAAAPTTTPAPLPPGSNLPRPQ